jgi:hypothetical protein
MALWRDPLDELIEDLERAVPAVAGASLYQTRRRVEDLQVVPQHDSLEGQPGRRNDARRGRALRAGSSLSRDDAAQIRCACAAWRIG